jgi:hypothetical protein
MIRVKYNPITSLVEGYFPKNISYNKNKINKKTKTIDGSPYIEITNEEHQSNLSKIMCVIDGIYQEYIKAEAELLTEARNLKYREVEQLRKSLQFKFVSYQGSDFSASQMARQNMLSILNANEPSNSKYYWQDETGKAQSFTLDNFKEILKNISTRDSKLYYIEAQINTEISLNNNPAAIEKLNIKELWKSYEDNYSKQN